MLVGILNNIYRSKFFSALFHTQHHCLKKELSDCDSVLDIGCGPSSPIQYLQIKYSVGVEVFEPYYQLALKNKTHTLCLNDKIEDLEFAEKSFDAVVMIGVLEHFPKEVIFRQGCVTVSR